MRRLRCLILAAILSGCHAARPSRTTFAPPTTAEANAEFRKLRRLEQANREAIELLPLPAVKVGHIGPAVRNLSAPQYYLRWDRPYPENPTNRYEIWATTNLIDWFATTNTRFGEMKLDTTQYPLVLFKIRTAIYGTLPDGSVDWDGLVNYSDWARK